MFSLLSVYQQKKYALSLKMLDWLLWVLNFSSLFAYDVELKSNYWRLYMIWLYFAWKHKCRDFFFSQHATISRISTISTFHFQYFASSCCFVGSVYMKLPLTSALPVFCHPSIKVLSCTVVNIHRAVDYWWFWILTHYNSIPFLSMFSLSEVSYTL